MVDFSKRRLLATVASGRQRTLLHDDGRHALCRANRRRRDVSGRRAQRTLRRWLHTIERKCVSLRGSSDGQRFLVITPEETASNAAISVVLNWPSALRN